MGQTEPDLAFENNLNKQGKKKGVEIGHDEEADHGGDDAKKLDPVVRRDAAGEVVGDGLIIDRDEGAGNKNDQAKGKPSKTKIPIHKLIIHLIL